MIKFILKLVFSVAICYGAFRGIERVAPGFGAMGILIPIFFLGHLFPRDILSFFSAMRYHAKKSVLYRWHGRYYSFEGQQLRFFLIDDVVWLALPDLEKILEPDIGERELRLLGEEKTFLGEHHLHVVSEAGMLQLLRTRTDSRHATQKMIRFKKWLKSSGLDNVKRLPKSAINNPRNGS